MNFTSVYYNDTTGNRIVKGPLGIVETYKFTTLQGVPKVTEIDRAANGTVASATETFAYDSNGYPQQPTDWNGNQTSTPTTATACRPQIVFASARPYSQTTNITYDTTWAHLAHTITTHGLTATFTYDSAAAIC